MHRLELPYPVSVNRYYRNFRGMTVRSAEARDYKSAVHAMAVNLGVSDPLSGAIHVEISYHPKRPKKYTGGSVRAFDLDNCLKVAIDALNGIAWHDDKQITFLAIRKGEPVPDGALIVQWRADDQQHMRTE